MPGWRLVRALGLALQLPPTQTPSHLAFMRRVELSTCPDDLLLARPVLGPGGALLLAVGSKLDPDNRELLLRSGVHEVLAVSSNESLPETDVPLYLDRYAADFAPRLHAVFKDALVTRDMQEVFLRALAHAAQCYRRYRMDSTHTLEVHDSRRSTTHHSAPPSPDHGLVRLDSAEVLSRVRRLHSLPALPVVVRALLRDIHNPQSHMQQVARILAHDQALTARILKVANSPFYAPRQAVRSVEQAVPLLGLRTIEAMLFKSGIVGSFGSDKQARGFWLHALGTACAARAIARMSGMGQLEQAFVAGLLHDIGKLALAEALPEEYAIVRNRVAWQGGLIRTAEEAVFGCDHARVGLELASRWSLPTEFVEAIAHHHHIGQASPEAQPWAAVVHLADILARALMVGSGGDRSIPVIDPLCWKLLRLDSARIEALCLATEEELGLAEIFFNVIDED